MLLDFARARADATSRRGRRVAAVAWLLLAVVWMAVAVALAARRTLPLPAGLPEHAVEPGGHVVFFAVLAGMVHAGLRAAGWLDGRRRPGAAFLAVMAFGVGVEALQAFVPVREATLMDLLADALGGVIGALGAGWIGRRGRVREDPR